MEKLVDTDKAETLWKFIEESERIVLTCHVRPDGDAIGSTLGLRHLMRTLGKEAWVVVPDKAPASLGFLPGFKELAVNSCHPEFCRRLVSEADLIICCDFNTPSRQDSLAPIIQGAKCRKVLIDHHREPDSFTDITFSYPDMSSASELCFRIIAAMGLYGEVGPDAATCLLTGIVTDTRNFSVNCSHPDIYEILMRLISKGADKEKIVRESLNTRSYWSIKLEACALSAHLKVYPRHRCALITLGKDVLCEYNYERGDTEGLVNRPLEIKGVIYSVFMREDSDCIKVSARSKSGFPVSEICKDLYGGGGHLMAAGGEFNGSLADCRKKLEEAMAHYDRYLPPDLPSLKM